VDEPAMTQQEIEECAASWVIEFDTAPPQRKRFMEFEAWLAADPRHRAAYLAIERSWQSTLVLRRGKSIVLH
jgi:transmembrane sensor